ncbi:Aldehyde dehydrogenase family 16 member A1 [Hypsibius exemplaris]|uniref:Aldehyde dehydrogenase family 16 member A1 n=1 Tax=Hypsibius exemplaris TaxID=2072580 RepID=A0A9X6NHS4_HYPEX|nr:Aldehyde dehydrogenase family 16 member A1 [Hypsibius exemplaris]
MSSAAPSTKEAFLAAGLPLSSAMESLDPLRKWFADRGNVIETGGESGKHGTPVGVRTSTFEEPDQTPGLTVKVWLPDALDGLFQSSEKAPRPSGKTGPALLYSLARNMQKNSGILSLTLSADSKRGISECRKHDVPLAIQTAYHFAGASTHSVDESAKAGVSCLIPSYHSPLLDIINHVCPAVLSGHSIVLLSLPQVTRTVAVLMDILQQSGFPSGLVTFAAIQTLPKNIDHIAFLHICMDDKEMAALNAEPRKASQLLPSKIFYSKSSRSTAIITDTADVDSAVASVLEAAVFAGGRANSCPTRILVQETILERFQVVLQAKSKSLRCGSHLDKSVDYASTIGTDTVKKNVEIFTQVIKEGAEVWYANAGTSGSSASGTTNQLLLSTATSPASVLFSGEYSGPLMAILPFRTVKEAVALANNGAFGASCSVWSENTAAALEIARNVKAATVWINAHNLSDAVVGAGGSLGSGWPVSGSEVLYDFSPSGLPTFSLSSDAMGKADRASPEPFLLDRTYKMYYGGGQKRPESGTSVPVSMPRVGGGKTAIQVPDGGQKDLKNAIDAAVAGSTAWAKATPFNRSQILFYLAENLSGRLNDFTTVLLPFHKSRSDAAKEVTASVEALFFWAGQCDKNNGQVITPSSASTVMHLREPLGVVGAVLPDQAPLLSFAHVMGAALAFGNAVVVVPALQTAVVALEFCQILETSDVPAGVVNIITGRPDALSPIFGVHSAVSAVWVFWSSASESAAAAAENALQLATLARHKVFWKATGAGAVDWSAVLNPGNVGLFRHYATQNKRIWLPALESFAN